MTSESLKLPDPERATPEDLLAHAAWVRRLARALVGDAASADDVVQDTWLAVLRHPPAADRPVRPWLARVVANVASNRRRSEVRRAGHESAPRQGGEVPSPQAIAAEIEMQRLLLDAIETLAEAQRAVLVRHFFHGQSAASIARADGVSETTVRTRIAHAIEVVRKKLDDRHRGDRSAWVALVIPCARHETQVTTTAAASVAGTLIAMNVLVKVGVAAAVLVVGLGVYELAVKRVVEPRSPSGSPLVAGIDALADSPRIAPTGTVPNRVGLAGENAVSAQAAAEDVGWLEMTVHDARGIAIANAVVTCVDNSRGDNVPIDGIPTWTTDADGFARHALPLAKLPPPEEGQPSWWTHVEIAAPAHAVATESVSFHRGGVYKLSVVLADGGEVVGRVLDGGGIGVADADVSLVDPEMTLEQLDAARIFGIEDRGPRAATKTSADGAFRFRGVPSVSYRAWTMPGARLCAISDKFDVRVGEHVELPPLVVDEDPDAITGTMLTPDGTRCDRGEVVSFETPAHLLIRGLLDARGGFVIKCPKQAMIDVELDGANDHDEGNAVLHDVHAGTRDLIVRLRPTRWIEARVRDRSGKPIEAFSIGVTCDNGGSVNGVHDRRDGTLRVRVPTARFTVMAMATGYVAHTSEPIDPEHAPAQIDFDLDSAPSLSGRVVLEGVGVKGSELRLVRSMPAGKEKWHNGVQTPFDVFHDELETRSGDDGSFAFTLTAGGTYVVCAAGPSDTASGETEPIDVDCAHPPKDIVIALGRGGVLEGSILTQPGDESSFQWIEVIRPTGEIHAQPIVSGGAYRFEHLAEGRWWIRRVENEMHEGHDMRDDAPSDPTARTFDVVEGRVTHFDLDVRATPSPVLLGHVEIAGSKSAEWTATFQIRDSWDFASDRKKVSADGSFRLRSQATGTGGLVLDTPATADRAQRIESDVRLQFGVNTWSLDVATGSISIARSSSAQGLLSHIATLPSGAKFITDFKLTPGAPLVLDHVAAGKGRIVDASGKVLAEVDVPSGGQAQVSLP